MNKKKIFFISVAILIIGVFLIALGTNKNIDFIRLKGDISTLNGISVECDKNNLSINEVTNCNLYLDTGLYSISGFQGELSSNSNIKISDIKKSDKWSFGDDNTSDICYYNESPLTGKLLISTFKLTGVSEGVGNISVKQNSNGVLIMTDVSDSKDIPLSSVNKIIKVNKNVVKKTSNNEDSTKTTKKDNKEVDCNITSKIYTINQPKLVIYVSGNHDDKTIIDNLSSTCGEIEVKDDKAIVKYSDISKEYQLERRSLVFNKYVLLIGVFVLGIGSVILIIGILNAIKNR